MKTTLDSKEYLHVPYAMPRSGMMQVHIKGTDPSNAYLLTNRQMRLYELRQNFVPLAGGVGRTDHTLIATYVPNTQVHLVVENSTRETMDVHYDVLEFFSYDCDWGLGGFFD